MIVSHKYKFIFLKTNKTASTSVEIALSKFCGPDDIITTISDEDEKTKRELGYPGPQNHMSSIWGYTITDILRMIVKRRKKFRFYNHIPARKIKAYIDKETWNSYFKFCIERNPWDRVISYYYWRYKTEPRPTIAEFINSRKTKTLKNRGRRVYTINDKIAVDKICKFENLSEELETVRKHVGIPEPLVLPQAKSMYRKDLRSYRDILDPEGRDVIAAMFREEIDLLGYEW